MSLCPHIQQISRLIMSVSFDRQSRNHNRTVTGGMTFTPIREHRAREKFCDDPAGLTFRKLGRLKVVANRSAVLIDCHRVHVGPLKVLLSSSEQIICPRSQVVKIICPRRQIILAIHKYVPRSRFKTTLLRYIGGFVPRAGDRLPEWLPEAKNTPSKHRKPPAIKTEGICAPGEGCREGARRAREPSPSEKPLGSLSQHSE